MQWTWFHKFASPKWFYQITGKILPFLAWLTFFLLVIGLVLGLGYAPADAKQGNSFRIIYIHVPSNFLALAGYFLMAIAGAIGLIWRIKLAFWVMKCAAPIGVVFTLVGLLTGSLWGKPTWGTWWAWDARITSMLILMFFYALYLISWRIYENKDQIYKITLIITILGFINVPITKFSVDWWNTLHQPASINIFTKSSIHESMLFPLAIMTAAFALFSLLIFLMKYNTELIKIKNKGLDRI